MATRSFVVISLAVATAALALAQNPATSDLSGTWVLNVAKSKLAPHTFIVSAMIAIKCSGTTIHIYNTINGKKYPPWIYTTDGKEHLFAELPGGDEVAKASWQESVLVTRLIGRRTRPPFDFTDRWTVSADGRTLTQESSGRLKQTFVYDKQ